MTIWKLTINIKHLITGDESDGDAATVSTAIADVIDAAIPKSWQVLHFEGIEEIVEDLRNCNGLDMANECISDLYDWGDEYRVWLGP